ncbi:hypothetical protein F444_12742 [Phytophthora nicotianae P1976]|uniref:DDE Tnp4 domain-containing protein n=1 Tax=Phytophthora nicotianae P1976 TaxID=1317066 RepID=A0A080ZW20_PHYNI|nr:hypothetical protein F444_12742 [Phytophthora nicotianae P1976]
MHEEDDDFDVLLLLTAAHSRREACLSSVRREVHQQMIEGAWRAAMRTRHYLTVSCLDVPCVAAWMALYKNGFDSNFLNATSLTRAAFKHLLRRFARYYYIPPARSRGKPPKLRYHHQALGLVLCFYVGSMENGTLCMLFGVPPSTLSRTLCKAEEALSCALRDFAPARISWPSPSRQRELASLVNAREPLLQYTFGFIDGKNFRVQQHPNSDLQNAMYNGWLHSVLVTGTICFAADGCII